MRMTRWDMQKQIAYLKKKYEAEIELLRAPLLEISSNDDSGAGSWRGWHGFVPDVCAWDYIKEHHFCIWRKWSHDGDFGIRKKLEKRLNQNATNIRWARYTAASLAMCYRNEYTHQAMLVVFAWSVVKFCLQGADQIAGKCHCRMTDSELKMPALIHAVAYYLVEHEYNIEDSDLGPLLHRFHHGKVLRWQSLEKSFFWRTISNPAKGVPVLKASEKRRLQPNTAVALQCWFQ